MVFHMSSAPPAEVAALLHDRMTETVLGSFDEAAKLFEHVPPRPLKALIARSLEEANRASASP